MLNELSHGQRERLTYIDFCLQFFGSIARNDLIQRFQMGLASCSRDFATYKELAPDNLVLKHETKRYYRTEAFQPVFDHDGERALSYFSKHAALELPLGRSSVVAAVDLINVAPAIIAALTRAITANQAVAIEYASLSSGLSQREIVPHAFLNSGHRWHVRAFDRKSKQFRDFVCTRITSIQAATSDPDAHEQPQHDIEWNTDVTLNLVPHPKHQHPKAIELDYQMQHQQLELTLRVAEAKYLLRFWNVDVTAEATLDPNVCHLWLKNSDSLIRDEKVATVLTLAPGNKGQGSKND
ncbi:WYL domain-containing protein [Pseudidiomarina homiensis]|uniref:WYL domain-containing protein n=1 Tax=Pseudidiomarina homiensis TaxID=364198 RepID=UPI00215B0B36|nr:WYL domain-containing protein [Pseudidiomarina homiensis]